MEGTNKGKQAITMIFDFVSGLLFFSMFVMFIIAIFFRYVLNAPISWSIEYIMVSFLLMMFWTLSFNVPITKHVAFSILRDALPPWGKRIFSLITNLVGVVIFAFAVPGLVSITLYERHESTPILHFPYLPLYGSFALFVVTFAIRLVVGIVALLRPNWREHV